MVVYGSIRFFEKMSTELQTCPAAVSQTIRQKDDRPGKKGGQCKRRFFKCASVDSHKGVYAPIRYQTSVRKSSVFRRFFQWVKIGSELGQNWVKTGIY